MLGFLICCKFCGKVDCEWDKPLLPAAESVSHVRVKVYVCELMDELAVW